MGQKQFLGVNGVIKHTDAVNAAYVKMIQHDASKQLKVKSRFLKKTHNKLRFSSDMKSPISKTIQDMYMLKGIVLNMLKEYMKSLQLKSC